MLQSVIRNAWAGDPYRIDTLLLFMSNMGWNSSMNTTETRRMLCDRDTATGEYRIPHIIYADAYASETVAFADLVLPDTTYLERHDCISLLDRPISDADSAADAIRQPVVALDAEKTGRDVRPFQDVLLDLGARLGLPGLIDENGHAKYPRGYAQYIVEHERSPGVGLLAGWRGAEGSAAGIGAPNPDQLARYIENGCHWHREVPAAARYYKMANRDYLEWAKSLGFVGSTEPITLQFYAETLQRFRLAAQGHGATQPPARDRARVERYFAPLPFWYASLEGDESSRISSAERPTTYRVPQSPHRTPSPLAGEGRDEGSAPKVPPATQNLPSSKSSPLPGEEFKAFPLSAITQRPMFMYHAWGSQNRWLRQIATRNALYVHPDTARDSGIDDGDWIWIVAPRGRIRAQLRTHTATAPGTVWTWNAIGKRKGAWKLAAGAPEFHDGFLLNHLIDEQLPRDAEGVQRANADPVTGQAAWFDLRVRIERDNISQEPGHRIEVIAGNDAA
jgi:anaerobic selenocysteine-containing dehydrogenase